MLFNLVNSGCIVNIKILFEIIAALHEDTDRLYMTAQVLCQHLEVTVRHLQCCKQGSLLQAGTFVANVMMKKLSIDSWSYWSACPVY